MPRTGTGNYVIPAGTYGVPNATVQSTPYNFWVDDVATDLNTPRPIAYGGTAGTDARSGLKNLSGEMANQVVTNYDAVTEWLNGSFYSSAGAINAPNSTNPFYGQVLNLNDNQGYVTLLARDSVTGFTYKRERLGGAWGPWVQTDLGLGNAGRLVYNSPTLLLLTPYNGDTIRINGQLRKITPGGVGATIGSNITISGTPGTLAANTLYYVYAWMGGSGGAMALDFGSQPAGFSHAPSSTLGNVGNEVMFASSVFQDTRTLVGMIYTDATGKFQDNSNNRCVRSWLNRVAISETFNLSANFTQVNGPYASMGMTACNVLTWADESTLVTTRATVAPASGTAGGAYLGLTFRSSTVATAAQDVLTAPIGSASLASSYAAPNYEGYTTMNLVSGAQIANMLFLAANYTGYTVTIK